MSQPRLLLFGVLGLAVFVFGILAVSRSRSPAFQSGSSSAPGLLAPDTSPVPAVPPGEEAPTPTLVPYTSGTASGHLLPVYAKDDTLTGWTYQDADSEHTCSAGPDGVWKSCTFSSKEQPWPSPVPQELLNNPPSLPPETEGNDTPPPEDRGTLPQ